MSNSPTYIKNSRLFNEINTKNIKGDIFGGLIAAVIALPLALAFGVSSGAGAITGVYGAILVGFFAALFGGTATQVSGPTGPMTVVMAAVLTQMIASNPEQGLVLAFTAVVLAGLIQIAFGLLKLGKYFVMVPYPVISGFMSGIGLIIILLQIAPLFGMNGYSSVQESVLHLPDTFASMNLTATFTGVATLSIVFFWPKSLAKIIPSPLFALVITTALLTLVFSDYQLPVIGEIPSGFPELMLPKLSMDAFSDILYYAFLLAILGAIDSLLTSMVADAMTETNHNSDKELIGQGIGNSIAGLFGALPGAGATMRTAINIRSGGKTALSGIVHSLTLLAIVLWAGDYAQYIPHAVLAGMLIKVGIDIIDWRFLRRLRQIPFFSSLLMFLVLFLTVFVDLITAVMVGMFIANIVTLERLAHLQLDNIIFKSANDLIEADNQTLANTLIFEIDGPVSFAVSRELSYRFTDTHKFEILLIDLSNAILIGTTTAVMVIEMIEKAQEKEKEVLIIMGNEKVNKTLKKLSIDKFIAIEYQYANLNQAIAQLQAR